MRSIVLLLAYSSLVVAAPVPKLTEAEKLKSLYGTPIDADKDCRILLDGDKLSLRTSDSAHLLNPSVGLMNAPRTAKEVEGDFVAIVRIRFPEPKVNDPAPGVRRGPAYAGLYLAGSTTDFVFHARTLVDQGGSFNRGGTHGGFSGGRSTNGGGSGGGAFVAETNYLRISRTGDKTKFAASTDMNTWHEFGGPDVSYPNKVTVGVYLANSGDAPAFAEFDQFTVAAAKQGK